MAAGAPVGRPIPRLPYTERMTFRAAALAIILFVVGMTQAAPAAGPFGLRFGMTAAQARVMGAMRVADIPNAYTLRTVPNGNSAFESYSLFISPTHGLCSVSGTGPDITNDAGGTRTRYAFAGLRATFVSIYGRPTSTEDSLKAGSVYSTESDWLTGILLGDRHYTATWDTLDHAKLPASYRSIQLYISPSGRSTGSIAVNYVTQDSHCLDDIRNADKNGL